MTSRLLGTLLVALAIFAPSTTAAAAVETIQPGDWVNVEGTGGCTLGWLFDGADGSVYFSSAGHCFTRGEVVELADSSQPQGLDGPAVGEPLGTVVADGDDSVISSDAALILVRPELHSRVRGDLRGHPDVPSGIAGTATAGDLLQLSGWGTGWELNATSREQRQGALSALHPISWAGVIPVTGGDSGGPVAHAASGGALGLVKGHGCDTDPGQESPCRSHGPTVQGIQAVAASEGLSLTMRLAGQPAPTPPAPAAPPSGQQQQEEERGEAAPAQSGPQPDPSSKPRSSRASRRAACQRAARKRFRKGPKRKLRAALRRCARRA